MIVASSTIRLVCRTENKKEGNGGRDEVGGRHLNSRRGVVGGGGRIPSLICE